MGLIAQLQIEDLIIKEKIGRSILIKAHLNDRFIFYKKWVNMFLLLESGLIQKISEKNIQTLILFGSYSRGEDNEKSDIDLASDIDIEEDLSKYEKMLNRKIQIHKLSKKMPNTLIENIKQGILLDGIMI